MNCERQCIICVNGPEGCAMMRSSASELMIAKDFLDSNFTCCEMVESLLPIAKERERQEALLPEPEPNTFEEIVHKHLYKNELLVHRKSILRAIKYRSKLPEVLDEKDKHLWDDYLRSRINENASVQVHKMDQMKGAINYLYQFYPKNED